MSQVTPEMQAQVEKLKEELAKWLWDENNLEKWTGWSTAWVHNKYLDKATSLLRTVLADLKVDTGELTDEEIADIYMETDTVLKKTPRIRREWIDAVKRRGQTVRLITKAARAKFVSVGEIVKEMEK